MPRKRKPKGCLSLFSPFMPKQRKKRRAPNLALQDRRGRRRD